MNYEYHPERKLLWVTIYDLSKSCQKNSIVFTKKSVYIGEVNLICILLAKCLLSLKSYYVS